MGVGAGETQWAWGRERLTGRGGGIDSLGVGAAETLWAWGREGPCVGVGGKVIIFVREGAPCSVLIHITRSLRMHTYSTK